MKRNDDKRITSLQGIFGLNLHNTYTTHTMPIISVSTLSIFHFFAPCIVIQLCNIKQRNANLRINVFNLESVHFVGLCCIIR
jgi:hypothetical protein